MKLFPNQIASILNHSCARIVQPFLRFAATLKPLLLKIIKCAYLNWSIVISKQYLKSFKILICSLWSLSCPQVNITAILRVKSSKFTKNTKYEDSTKKHIQRRAVITVFFFSQGTKYSNGTSWHELISL